MNQQIPSKRSRRALVALNVLKESHCDMQSNNSNSRLSAQVDQTRIVPTNSKDKFFHEEFLSLLLHPHLKFKSSNFVSA